MKGCTVVAVQTSSFDSTFLLYQRHRETYALTEGAIELLSYESVGSNVLCRTKQDLTAESEAWRGKPQTFPTIGITFPLPCWI